MVLNNAKFSIRLVVPDNHKLESRFNTIILEPEESREFLMIQDDVNRVLPLF